MTRLVIPHIKFIPILSDRRAGKWLLYNTVWFKFHLQFLFFIYVYIFVSTLCLYTCIYISISICKVSERYTLKCPMWLFPNIVDLRDFILFFTIFCLSQLPTFSILSVNFAKKIISKIPCVFFFSQPHFKKDLRHLINKATSTKRFLSKQGHLETRARNKSNKPWRSQRLRLLASTQPECPAHWAEGGTHWLGVSRHPQNIPPQPPYLNAPVLIKFCLGKDNENIFLHFLIILPDEIMQLRNVLREEEPAARTSDRMLTVLPHCSWGWVSVCTRAENLPKDIALTF